MTKTCNWPTPLSKSSMSKALKVSNTLDVDTTPYATFVERDREPLVPVTETVTTPAELNVQERVEVPEPPVTVMGVRVQAELSDVRATSPINMFTGEIVIVEVPAEPMVAVTAVGLAEMVKSGRPLTVKVTVAE